MTTYQDIIQYCNAETQKLTNRENSAQNVIPIKLVFNSIAKLKLTLFDNAGSAYPLEENSDIWYCVDNDYNAGTPHYIEGHNRMVLNDDFTSKTAGKLSLSINVTGERLGTELIIAGEASITAYLAVWYRPIASNTWGCLAHVPVTIYNPYATMTALDTDYSSSSSSE